MGLIPQNQIEPGGGDQAVAQGIVRLADFLNKKVRAVGPGSVLYRALQCYQRQRDLNFEGSDQANAVTAAPEVEATDGHSDDSDEAVSYLE